MGIDRLELFATRGVGDLRLRRRYGRAVGLMVYGEDVDARFKQAVAAGAKVVKPVQDQFYGDRSGTLTDPFGHKWTIGTHKEDVSSQEMQRRMQAMKPPGAG